MLRLRFLVDGEERVAPLAGSRLTLGRGPDNDVVLADVSVSRHHAELRSTDGAWTVHDLRSTNGVELNRVPVASAPLALGDRLTIGAFELRVEGEPPPTSPQPVPGPATRPAVSAGGPSILANATIIRPIAEFAIELGRLAGPAGPRSPEVGGPEAPREPRPAGMEDEDGYARRMLGFLTRLGRVLITADSVDDVFSRVLDLAYEALPVERGFFLLRPERREGEDGEGELVCELARVRDRVEVRPQGEVPVSRTMLQEVMRERVALVTYDAMTDQRLSGGESIRLHQIRAAMCAPLWSGDRIIGVVQLDSPFKVGAFDERDLDFLTALANYVAVAVERIRYARRAELEREARSRLERYHSPAVIEEVLRDQGGGGLRRPRAAEASVLFADLVGFTTFSEAARPEEVAELLDAFLSGAVEAIFEAGGTLDKFIGDCVMAFFGAPVPQPDHARRAVQAAVEIQRRLAEWSGRRREQGLSAFSARVAVNSGPVVVGDIGSRRRVDYTVLGNTVNVAARLEAFVARPRPSSPVRATWSSAPRPTACSPARYRPSRSASSSSRACSRRSWRIGW
jgi:adenylate cyclase